MSKSESIKELAAALAKFQSEVDGAPMNATNPFLNNKYADLGSVIETARPHLSKNGLSVTQLVNTDEGGMGVTTILMHQSGEWIETHAALPMSEERGKSAAQVAGSIVTYLRRYQYAAILGMYADEDSDGNVPQTKPAPAPQRVQMTTEDGMPVINEEGEPVMTTLPAGTFKFPVAEVYHAKSKDNSKDLLKIVLDGNWEHGNGKYGLTCFHAPEKLANFKEWEIDKRYKAPAECAFVIVRAPSGGSKFPEVLEFQPA